MDRKKLVLIGNGMAGMNTVETILKLSDRKFDITVFGSEPHPNYNRILLSSVLAGSARVEDIVINPLEWYAENGIRLHTGETVTAVDPASRTLRTDKGRTEAYDELILATGSLPFMLPLPGADKEGVIAFRDIKDCETMIETAKHHRKAAVIGGGLLGLEAARGLLNLGMEVSVIHICDYLMERQLDAPASKMLRAELERQGMSFLLSKQTKAILGDARVTGVEFADGTSVDADLVVMAVGIRPNVSLAKESGIGVNRGIVVNDYMQTDQPHIYAVGECAEHNGMVYGLVAPLYEQGAVLAKTLCGTETPPYRGSVLSTKLKVSGVDVFSAGEFVDGEDTQAVCVHDEWNGVYKKVLLRNRRIIGGVLFGDTSEGSTLFRLIRTGAEMTPELHASLVGGPSAKSGAPVNAAAAMAPDELICGCNGVTKETIVRAIREQGLTSVDAVKGCTGASRSCGGCKPLVGQLLEHVLGDGFETPVKETVCSCTTLSRDELVEAIREKRLTHMREVMNVLGWSTEEGCSKCRPALNYYLAMVWPDEYEDAKASRFVNERMHANIQHNGTYSVVPRMYGGVTSPSELRRIADAAEKYGVKMVKVTGGQRLDLLGVKKEDLPSIWADLDMPSGWAYGKALRTVKTCVGADFCRFGTQNSIQMGIDIEKKYERLNTPAKVKMAVSGCPRNCAESGIKDLGVVAVDGGWELYAGGNGGVKLRGGDLLCKVKTSEEVMDITGAYLQFYRETGNYGERTSEWVVRIGLDTIREAVVENTANRQALLTRVEKVLEKLTDPWKDVINNRPKYADLYDGISVASE
ncbi:nitrite reductase large subunit NirB [Paenibacillus aurantius]|uniref:Nitrite reductase large subunit NirB n=1 Tax=Paenibacillus aurantius TaxID=2918900 RepID=A0AA96RGS7_9BACL|nr:nitrite reductase large subunit NirB [Paenibacillus aurantius]WNQ12806.1 nitrite reductase large subunit NirB [Paenibacillus aurantius]